MNMNECRPSWRLRERIAHSFQWQQILNNMLANLAA